VEPYRNVHSRLPTRPQRASIPYPNGCYARTLETACRAFSIRGHTYLLTRCGMPRHVSRQGQRGASSLLWSREVRSAEPSTLYRSASTSRAASELRLAVGLNRCRPRAWATDRRLLEIANVSSQWCFAERGPFSSESGMALLDSPVTFQSVSAKDGYGSRLKIPSVGNTAASPQTADVLARSPHPRQVPIASVLSASVQGQ